MSGAGWRHEALETWRLIGGAKLFGISSTAIALLAYREARNQIVTEWVGDHLERVFVTAVFVLVAAAVGGALGLTGAVREFRGGVAFWWGIAGVLANLAMPVAVLSFLFVHGPGGN